jgi:hypothetical protein
MSVPAGTRVAVGALLQRPAHPARNKRMTKKTVLAIGIDPSLVDFGAFPGLTLELVRNFIDTQIVKLRAQGYDAESCLIDLGETAEAVTKAAGLKAARLRRDRRGTARTVRAFAAVREDTQSRSRARPARRHLFQHHAGRHGRGRAAVGDFASRVKFKAAEIAGMQGLHERRPLGRLLAAAFVGLPFDRNRVVRSVRPPSPRSWPRAPWRAPDRGRRA